MKTCIDKKSFWGGFNTRPNKSKEGKMVRRFQRNDDWCPECGHLLPKRTWNCPFCGWSIHDLQIDDYGIDTWDDYSDLKNISNVDQDIDRLIGNS